LAVSLIWVGAMVDLLRREDLTQDQNTMWFAALLVGNLLAAIIYVIWRIVGLTVRSAKRKKDGDD
jgi:hypothetical protein